MVIKRAYKNDPTVPSANVCNAALDLPLYFLVPRCRQSGSELYTKEIYRTKKKTIAQTHHLLILEFLPGNINLGEFNRKNNIKC